MANIRRAGFHDLDALVKMASAMHAESPRFKALDFDSVKTADFIQGLLYDEKRIVLLAEQDSQITGMMGGFVIAHFFGDDRVACDIGLYVAHEHRGGLTALRLVRAFEAWAVAQGAKDIVLGISTEVKAVSTRNLYLRLGYAQSGYLMRKELQDV